MRHWGWTRSRISRLRRRRRCRSRTKRARQGSAYTGQSLLTHRQQPFGCILFCSSASMVTRNRYLFHQSSVLSSVHEGKPYWDVVRLLRVSDCFLLPSCLHSIVPHSVADPCRAEQAMTKMQQASKAALDRISVGRTTEPMIVKSTRRRRQVGSSTRQFQYVGR